MFGIGFKSIILVSVLIVLLTCIGLMGYTTYFLSSRPKYVIAANDTVTTKGVDAADVWVDKKWFILAPIAGLAYNTVMVAMLVYLN